MRFASLLAIVLLSCAHTREVRLNGMTVVADTGKYKHPLMGCVSPCGIIAPYATDCDGLAEAERRALYAYARNVRAFTEEKACKALHGWSVYVYPGADSEGVWVEPAVVHARRVLGLTYVNYKQMYIGFEDWIASAFVHEVGHALDWELTPKIAEKAEHPLWKTRGFCRAINQASTLKDNCDDYK